MLTYLSKCKDKLHICDSFSVVVKVREVVKFATRDVGLTRVVNMPQISHLPSFDHICTQVRLCVCTKIACKANMVNTAFTEC